MSCRHYWVTGRVQGVFYRASTQDKALSLGLTGWVKNLPDGRVEVLACGADEILATLELWLKQGPPMAHVDHLEIKQESITSDMRNFDVRY